MLPPKKEIITAEKAPRAIGPYSAGIRAGNFIFTSGQLGLERATGELISGGIEAETRQAFLNLQDILESSGSGLNHVIKTTVFLRDMNDFARMNGVYAQFFTKQYPARTTVQVAALPKGAAVEIEAVAILPSPAGD